MHTYTYIYIMYAYVYIYICCCSISFAKSCPAAMVFSLQLQPCLGHCSAGLSGHSEKNEEIAQNSSAYSRYYGMDFDPLWFLSILEPEPRGLLTFCWGAFARPWARSFWTASRVLPGLFRRMNRMPLPCSQCLAQKAQVIRKLLVQLQSALLNLSDALVAPQGPTHCLRKKSYNMNTPPYFRICFLVFWWFLMK